MGLDKIIKINIQNATLVPIDSLSPIQGDLKSLSKENFEKLKSVLIQDGFNEPITTWLNPKTNKRMILNGHQRHRVMWLLKEEGYHIDGIPIVEVTAANEKAAVEICLTLASQFGEVQSDGLYALLDKHSIDWGSLDKKFHFPEISIDRFKEEFLDLAGPAGTAQDKEVATCKYCHQTINKKQ